jgi:predicted CopG family antitoxin
MARLEELVRVSSETWSRLNRRKRPGDTFNDVIVRLLDADENGDSDGG